MAIQITGRTSFAFETTAEGQAFRFEIFADTRDEATRRLLAALRRIAVELESELALKNN